MKAYKITLTVDQGWADYISEALGLVEWDELFIINDIEIIEYAEDS